MAKTASSSEHKYNLAASKRTVFGKKLKKVRREGAIPSNIFGPGFTSVSISVPQKDFSKIFSKAKETGIIYIALDGTEIPVLARQIQRHPLTHNVLHVDFRKVDLTKKIETEVPIKVVGESSAVATKGGVLITNADHLLVESLPEDIPSEIEVDISKLEEVGAEIKVSELAKGAKYEFKEEADKVVVSVIAHKEESLEPEVAAPEAAEGAEGAPAEGEAAAAEADAATPAEEGEKKAPETKEKPEAKKEE